MRIKASLQSRSLPSVVATNTPSCICSNRRRYFSSAAWIRGITNHVNGPLLSAVLLGVSRGRNHYKATEAGVWPFVKGTLSAFAVGATLPIRVLAGQNRFARIPNDVTRGLVQPLQERAVGFHDVEFSVMQQYDILDGVEGVAPLPVRPQN